MTATCDNQQDSVFICNTCGSVVTRDMVREHLGQHAQIDPTATWETVTRMFQEVPGP